MVVPSSGWVWAAPRRARRPAEPLRLDSNENPLGPAPAARQAILDAIAEAHRYPDQHREALVEALAARHGLSPANVVLGNGSTEVLQVMVQATIAAGGTVLMAEPTFEAVGKYTEPWGQQVQRVPLDARHAHDLGAMRERADRARAPVLIYVCNPNNPTGTITPSAELDAWIAEAPDTVWFLVDEAYLDYADDPAYHSAERWLRDRPNVVVARTFSKIHGLAGLRLGYGLAQLATAERLRGYLSQDNANVCALAAARASLDDRGHLARGREVNARGRRILLDCLDELGLEHLPSHTNFVLHRVSGDLGTYIARMRADGVWVGRPFPPMLGHNRVSIGTPDEMGRFTEVLRRFRRRGWV
jgi:histidinol-phosphate aminotransferase